MVTRAFALMALLGILAARPIAARFSPSTTSTSPRETHPASTAADSLQSELTTIEKQSWVAWQMHDANFFQSFLSDDHVEVGTTGIATKAQVVAYVGSGSCVVKSYSVDHFHATRFDSNTALLTYRADQQTTCGGAAVPSPTWVSSLFVRRNGTWVNALYQHTKAE